MRRRLIYKSVSGTPVVNGDWVELDFITDPPPARTMSHWNELNFNAGTGDFPSDCPNIYDLEAEAGTASRTSQHVL